MYSASGESGGLCRISFVDRNAISHSGHRVIDEPWFIGVLVLKQEICGTGTATLFKLFCG